MTDTSNKREDIVYLYVNSFEYKDKVYHDLMGGHPLNGRIYRALFDKDSKLYRIIFEDDVNSKFTGLIVKDLDKEDSRWIATLTVLTDENVLDYDIETEDFEKLAKWKDSKNSDVDSLRIENSVGSSVVEDGIAKLVFETGVAIRDLSTPKFISPLEKIEQLDSDIASALNFTMAGMISYLEGCDPKEPDLGKQLSKSPTHGKGSNCGIALEALTEYLQNDTYLAVGTLNKAVYYLLREVARINKVNE